MEPRKRHLFVEWRHWENIIVLGESVGQKFNREIQVACPLQELNSADVSTWLGERPSGEVLMFFHAMWGQQFNFHRKNLRSIEAILATQPNDGIQTVVSFIWHAGGALYVRNWQRAAAKGEPLGKLIDWICGHFNNKVSVLCHSMGSRVFEGVLRSVSSNHGRGTLFDKVILFSPDVDAGVGDSDFIRLRLSSSAVVVFIHRHDRLLLLSQWAHRRERLGRSGPSNLVAVDSMAQLSTIDMTDHVRGVQNHTHLDKSWVQRCMGELLKP